MIEAAEVGGVARMLRIRLLILTACAGLSACASAPPPQGSGGPYASSSLSLCGTNVSNAPAIDGRGRVIGYEPFVEIRGVRLARAPVAACLSSGFGPRPGGAENFHNGVDLYTRTPTLIRAAGDGVVVAVATLRGYGMTILIRHGRGVETRYAHLSEYAPGLREGARVEAGDYIGRTGETGNATAVHLHYEIIVDGRAVNPITVNR